MKILSKTTLLSGLLIIFLFTIGLFYYQWQQVRGELIKQTEQVESLLIQIDKLQKEIKELKSSKVPEETNRNKKKNDEEVKPELETYQSELFIQASWGKGEGEVGLSNPSDQGIEDAGPNYGPQSFDIDDKNNHLFLLDSVNERVIEYDEKGEYRRDFPIVCGGTGDIRVSPDSNYLYIFSWRCGGVYKYSLDGELLEGYQILPGIGESPGLCTEGLNFDEKGNIMLELRIDEVSGVCRFYQIGEKGNEWRENYYEGYISRDRNEFYRVRKINWQVVSVEIFDKKGSFQRAFTVNLLKKAYVYYTGCDNGGNVYLNVGFREPIKTEEGFYSDEFIWKYNREGKILAKINLFNPLGEFSSKINLLDIPRIYLYADDFISLRVTSKGDIYWMTSFKNEGLKIFKYSKVK